MIYDLFLIISRYNKYVMDPSCLSTCSTWCFIIWILFGGVSTCHFIVRRFFSVNFWTLVRGHRVQIIVPQGGWHLQFIDPQGGWHPPFYIIKWQVGPPLKSNPHGQTIGFWWTPIGRVGRVGAGGSDMWFYRGQQQPWAPSLGRLRCFATQEIVVSKYKKALDVDVVWLDSVTHCYA